MERIDLTVTGGCQCGAVRYRATQMLDNAHLCHCRMCQKAVGNLFAALVAAPNDALEWTRGTPAAFRSSRHFISTHVRPARAATISAPSHAASVSK